MIYSLFNSLINFVRSNNRLFLTNGINAFGGGDEDSTLLDAVIAGKRLLEFNPDYSKYKQVFLKTLQTIINSKFAIILNDYERMLIEKIHEQMLSQEISQFLYTYEIFKYTSKDEEIINKSNIILFNTIKKYNLNKKLILKESSVFFDAIIKKVFIERIIKFYFSVCVWLNQLKKFKYSNYSLKY